MEAPPRAATADRAGADPPAGPRQLVLVTGLSGAGKASVLRALEDLGFETVDNPPLAVLEALVSDGSPELAAGIDSRTRDFEPAAALRLLERLRQRPDVALTLVFVAADEAVLLRRYTETRRRHPLAPGGPLGSRVADGIAREAALLGPLREVADWVIDTSELPLPELRRMIARRFRPGEGGAAGAGLAITVVSFAYAKGLPREADLVLDLRFLRNPHYDPALRPLTGRDPAVAAHIEADPDYPAFWRRLTGLLDPLLPRYVAEGKKYLTIALGCTGGRHRSVLVAERLANHLLRQGWRAEVIHRELAAAAPGSDDDTRSGAGLIGTAQPRTGREALSYIP
ncbi:RNase adapter RapZ [Caldovatus aquaticus]|uniref:RNase adapter RapZ n=1 Tax=Caldovatus aquaticus TaxID=2865671 RepID=A0ABS7F6D2_9PROT|nr:RNase adapter RapZ [Caldovatus aquaticus]MBW8271175.1 RNase adapter RapZ [Caldovatus aquaticus]